MAAELTEFPRDRLGLPLEIRVHGRGGQGGVTCAKLIAAVYAQLGMYVQTFGDYGSERSGAPVRAYTRVGDAPIINRNKVYNPDHLLVLDAALMGPDVAAGVSHGTLALINTSKSPAEVGDGYEPLKVATVDATAIARKHGIGTSSVVIINTTIVGAYAKLLDLPMEAVEKAYEFMGLAGDMKAAREAYDSVAVREPVEGSEFDLPPLGAPDSSVTPILEHTRDLPTPLKTGSWRSQTPAYYPHLAPCSVSCPAGNDVVGFIRALREKGVDKAAALLRETQPLPSVCGRVCPGFCMESCNRGAYDGSVNIRGLERWIGDNGSWGPVVIDKADSPSSFAVVGGGPAGLSAAYQLRKRGHEVTIYESETRLGGVLRTGIPAYRLPEETLDREISSILAMGVSAHTCQRVDSDRLKKLSARYDGVVVATGFGSERGLDVSGYQLSGILVGGDFLHSIKMKRPVKLSGNVVVIGGGNTAMDCARSALRLGADKVTLVYRRGREEMPAIEEEIDDALAEGVSFLVKRQPLEFLGSSKVEGIKLAQVELGPPDESGRQRPEVTERTSRIACDYVLLALGQGIDESVIPEGWKLVNGRGRKGRSPINVWFAGDFATSEGTVAHAIGSGRKCVDRMVGELDGEVYAPPADPDPDELVTPGHIRFSHFPPSTPARERREPAGRRLGGFSEVSKGLVGGEEADRCFSCGKCTLCDTCLIFCPEGIIQRDEEGSYFIDNDYCKGCGVCVAECPRQAMRMTADEAAGSE